jgi:hypothetical protein
LVLFAPELHGAEAGAAEAGAGAAKLEPALFPPTLAGCCLGCALITFTFSVAGKINSPHTCTATQPFDATSANETKGVLVLKLNVKVASCGVNKTMHTFECEAADRQTRSLQFSPWRWA